MEISVGDVEMGDGDISGGRLTPEKRRLSVDTHSCGRTESSESLERGRWEAKQRCNDYTLDELPGARLGDGPRWDLSAAVERSRARAEFGSKASRELKALRRVGEGLLEQALGNSERADIVFEFGDGTRPFRGHSSVLCAACEEYAGLFRSGMAEERKGVVGVPPGITIASFRGFLEFLYLGRCGAECARADGRELAVLSEMYSVFGLRQWLVGDGIGEESALAALEFAMLPEGDRLSIEKLKPKPLQALDREAETSGSAPGELDGPSGIAFTREGDLVVADAGNSRVQLLSREGACLQTFGTRGEEEGTFESPIDVAVTGDGEIVVSDCESKRVQVFDARGGFLRSVGSDEFGPTTVTRPQGVAVGGRGEILVADGTAGNQVLVYDTRGSHIQTITVEEDLNLEAEGVRGIAVDSDGCVFAAFFDGQRLQMLS